MKATLHRMAIDHLWLIVFTLIAIFSAIVTFS
jgi:hypothetical protein